MVLTLDRAYFGWYKLSQCWLGKVTYEVGTTTQEKSPLCFETYDEIPGNNATSNHFSLLRQLACITLTSVHRVVDFITYSTFFCIQLLLPMRSYTLHCIGFCSFFLKTQIFTQLIFLRKRITRIIIRKIIQSTFWQLNPLHHVNLIETKCFSLHWSGNHKKKSYCVTMRNANAIFPQSPRLFISKADSSCCIFLLEKWKDH